MICFNVDIMFESLNLLWYGSLECTLMNYTDILKYILFNEIMKNQYKLCIFINYRSDKIGTKIDIESNLYSIILQGSLFTNLFFNSLFQLLKVKLLTGITIGIN